VWSRLRALGQITGSLFSTGATSYTTANLPSKIEKKNSTLNTIETSAQYLLAGADHHNRATLIAGAKRIEFSAAGKGFSLLTFWKQGQGS
jgi:hypothetical protein